MSEYDLLTELADKYCLDKGTGNNPEKTFLDVCRIKNPHSFTPFYNTHLFERRKIFTRVLEFGVLYGNSLTMWNEYFPNAQIYGFDINLDLVKTKDDIPKFRGDQSDRNDLQRFVDVYGSDFDLIIEDGGHTMEQQQVSFGFMFKHVKPGGVFILEDLHTSFMGAKYGVQDDQSNSTLNFLECLNNKSGVESQYISDEELNYILDNVEECIIFKQPHERDYGHGPSVTSVIKKRT
tara:strand:- start:16733 stop:17437 length:705 start_codon:yes stop_codon:yes gene_type:complete